MQVAPLQPADQQMTFDTLPLVVPSQPTLPPLQPPMIFHTGAQLPITKVVPSQPDNSDMIELRKMVEDLSNRVCFLENDGKKKQSKIKELEGIINGKGLRRVSSLEHDSRRKTRKIKELVNEVIALKKMIQASADSEMEPVHEMIQAFGLMHRKKWIKSMLPKR